MTQLRKLLTIIFASLIGFSFAQESRQISLQECMDQAVIQHPMYGQHQLQAALQNLKLDNLHSDLLPKVSLNGKATLQNEVVSL